MNRRLWTLCFIYGMAASFGLQHHNNRQTASAASSSSSSSSCTAEDALVDIPRLKETIAAGRVYQHRNFLSKSQVSYLLDEIEQLDAAGGFAPSGLSNTAANRQGFGNRDRTVCTVPWWKALLLSDPTNVSQDAKFNSNNSNNNNDNNTAAHQLNQLRLQLSSILQRPTMADGSLAHECYYSMSTKGSFLPRHMDERHEELKGAKGWLLPSRRSLSWLVYLSDENWTMEENGGALRSFVPQHHAAQGTTKVRSSSQSSSQHDGNLQVGWLSGGRPVYLNSWYHVVPEDQQAAMSTTTKDPHCVLYTIDEHATHDSNNDKVRLLTRPWLTDALQGTSVAEFLLHWSDTDQRATTGSGPVLFLRQDDARDFYLLEDRPAWDRGELPQGTFVEDVNPERGLLVVFDSVLVPHQVEEIRKGRRVALAGWFHEETQPFPESFTL